METETKFFISLFKFFSEFFNFLCCWLIIFLQFELLFKKKKIEYSLISTLAFYWLNLVLNVLITCGWKSNQGQCVKYHERNAYSGINHSGSNFTPRRKDGVGKFSPCARSFERASYHFYQGNRIDAGNCIAYWPFERVPRKETRNEKNYVNMDERFHTRSCGKSSQSLKQAPRLCNHNLESLPTLYGKRRKGVGFNTWSELKGA
ncbi:hypothetical protein M9H77_06972 [Catharanthus roseus]|uniref:Uncharacterized protein n=1 Tax=Catharanthus roseus TaxID=4058 RepID=A0ACC0BTW0_CATRO|nr:hypothetical protein M9H77_06972 [Catharanthus roseus]